MTRSCKELNPHIERYLNMVENGEIVACKEQHFLCRHIRKIFNEEDIYTDSELLEKYLRLTKYFPYEKLFEWEVFCLALHLCTFETKTGKPRFPDMFIMLGRGAGKDGYIAISSFCLISPHSGLKSYDVDICANAEEQAMRPLNDVLEILERNEKHLKKFFYWTKEKIVGRRLGGIVKGRTNNPKSKDGMRSGMVVFNEIHQYANYANLKVFITGLGKKKHPRRLYATTQGDIREGPLDDMLVTSLEILKEGFPDNGLLPFICRLDAKEEVDDKKNWAKANPSLPYLPDLMTETEKEYAEWKKNPVSSADFMTKRMNLPQGNVEAEVTSWENIEATNKEIPDLTSWECTCGIDYASINDFASVNLHFRKGELRFDINHSWLCLKSKNLWRLKIPYKQWAEQGLLTLVDDIRISPEMLTDWIAKKQENYLIKFVALDDYRHALLSDALSKIGFCSDCGNIKLVRPRDIMKIHPVIENTFTTKNFVWGDNPVLRWATNNTKLVSSSKIISGDVGNYYYAKIEGKARKTDPFMALTASMIVEGEINDMSDDFAIPEIIKIN